MCYHLPLFIAVSIIPNMRRSSRYFKRNLCLTKRGAFSLIRLENCFTWRQSAGLTPTTKSGEPAGFNPLIVLRTMAVSECCRTLLGQGVCLMPRQASRRIFIVSQTCSLRHGFGNVLICHLRPEKPLELFICCVSPTRRVFLGLLTCPIYHERLFGCSIVSPLQ